VTQGTVVNLHFNYGTGTNGDHADPNNVFYAAFINLDAGQKQQDMFTAANRLGSPIPAATGSTPTGYTTTVTIPDQTCSKCVLSIYDQRQWGSCIDLQVIPPLNGTTPAWPIGWIPSVSLAGYTVSNCVGPDFVWNNVTASSDGSTTGATALAYCCPAGAVSCGGRCWMGDAPKSMGHDVNLFADGSLCAGGAAGLVCNGTQSQAYCGYSLNGSPRSKCTDNCGLCNSLCDTSASKGYANCFCVGSNAVSNALAMLVLAFAAIFAVL